jgi:hypothetical protein
MAAFANGTLAMIVGARRFTTVPGIAAVWLLAACAPVAMGPVTTFADPGKYDFLSCGQLVMQRKQWAEREMELRRLMDKAEQSVAGAVVNVVAYQADYIAVRRAKACGKRPRPPALDATARHV